MLVAQLCLTLVWPHELVTCPGSSVHGIPQARILEWVAIPFSRDLPDPGIEYYFYKPNNDKIKVPHMVCI